MDRARYAEPRATSMASPRSLLQPCTDELVCGEEMYLRRAIADPAAIDRSRILTR